MSKLFNDKESILCEWEEGEKLTYLDIEVNLHEGTYRPFKKLNNNSKYLNRDSDHPTKVIESVPRRVAHRINMLCSNNEILTNVKREYENDLKSQGYKDVALLFKPPENIEERKARTEKKDKSQNFKGYSMVCSPVH